MAKKNVASVYGKDVADVMKEGKKLGYAMDVNNAIGIADKQYKEKEKKSGEFIPPKSVSMDQPPKGMKFTRTCSNCGKGVLGDGYVVGGGTEYYCSDKCLNKVYTPKQWDKMTAGDLDENGEDMGGNDENYWTEWYEEDGEWFEPEDEKGGK